jgi:hypothetical protein
MRRSGDIFQEVRVLKIGLTVACAAIAMTLLGYSGSADRAGDAELEAGAADLVRGSFPR